jgi:hypothetical protein
MGENLKRNLTDKLNINASNKGVCSDTICNKGNLFKIFYQNIRGLKDKTNELTCSFGFNYPHILCLMEYHYE